MTLIDPRIVKVLGVHRWKTMGVSSVECECGQILSGPEWLTEFPADEAFRGHIADALAPLIADAVADAAWDEVARLRGPFEAGVRQAIDWLRADYPYGSGPDWREAGCEWIADRLAEHTTALAAATPTDEAKD